MLKLSVRELRRRWKPAKERLQQGRNDQATAIRIHRAFSWMRRVEQFEEGTDHDLALLSQWIAFNSLYGQWDEQLREPKPDRESWRCFLDRVLALDQESIISASMTENKRLVMALLDDEYLSGFFWQNPTDKRASQSKKAKFDARTWYIEERWSLILERMIERIYLMRCQLAHGAATFGGKLNRSSLKRCVMMMDHLLGTILLVMIDHGADEDWGLMCYPPLT